MTDRLNLTPTEERVWAFLVQGEPYAAIAKALGISTAAAKVHGSNIRSKIIQHGKRKRAAEGISATIRELQRQDEQRGRRTTLRG